MRLFILPKQFFPQTSCCCRRLSSSYQIFDKKSKLLQRERAIRDPNHHVYEYLREEVGYRLYDNMYDIKRRFTRILDFGCGKGHFSKHLSTELTDEVLMFDSCPAVLDVSFSPKEGVKCSKKVIDDEDFFLEKDTLNLVVSCLSLHWINNLPGTFKQIIQGLKQDGAFMGTMFGGETLYELRSSLQLANLERRGGVSSHISPFVAVRDIGSLLTQAGFTLLTIDTDEIVVGYPSMFELMWDLQGMGENNAIINRCQHLDKNSMLAAAAIYNEMYGNEDKIRATFQLINFIAWKPDPSQPKPIARGSGEISLKDIDKLNEIIKKKGFIRVDEEVKKH